MESSIVKDVGCYRSLLSEITGKLTVLCLVWENKLVEEFSDEVGEEVCGQIRSVVGKARILMNRKGRLKQFEQLVDNCEFGYGEKETTYADLQGFWEMILLQIEDITKNFKGLEALERNKWKIGSNLAVAKPIAKKRLASHLNVKKQPASTREPSTRLRALMAAKKKELHPQKAPPTVVTSSPTNGNQFPPSEDKKVFEGVFFSVISPTSRKNDSETVYDNFRRQPDLDSFCLTPFCNSRGSKPESTAKSEVRTRRSHLNSAARRHEEEATGTAKLDKTPFAVMRVSSAFRKSMSSTEERVRTGNASRELSSRQVLDFDKVVEESENIPPVKNVILSTTEQMVKLVLSERL